MCRTAVEEVKGKREELRAYTETNADQLYDLLETIGATRNYLGRGYAGARTSEGREQFVKTTANTVLGKKLLMVCDREAKKRDDDVKRPQQ